MAERMSAEGGGIHSSGTPAFRSPAKKVASYKARVFGDRSIRQPSCGQCSNNDRRRPACGLR